MATDTQRNNLLHSVELKNWVVFREFIKHLHGILDAEQQKGNAVVVEIWSFPETRLPKKE